MNLHPSSFLPMAALAALTLSSAPLRAVELPAINQAMQGFVDRHEISGAVTVVASRDAILHLGATGLANLETGTPMSADTLFWIASMTKPVTAAAILLLQDEGKLSVDDPVAKYLPELGAITTPSGRPANLTLKHLLTHTSGMAEAPEAKELAATTLAELVPAFVQPTHFEPGSKWQYCQSGINSLGRIIEVVSGQSLESFFQTRFFGPLGMKDTTFHPNAAQQARIATSYQLADGKLTPARVFPIADPARPHFPAANGGLYSTGPDYVRFARMLLGGGEFEGHRFLSIAAVRQMSQVQSGDVVTGFTPGNAWGLGVCIVREPQGVSAALSAGSYGHGGVFGTQAWIDPLKNRIYLLFIQRANLPNSDASEMRAAFQATAAQ